VPICVFGRPPLRHSGIHDIRLWLRARPAATTPALHVQVAAFGDDRGVRLPPVGGEGVGGGRGCDAAGAFATVLLSVRFPATGSDAPPDQPVSPPAVVMPRMRAAPVAGPMGETRK